MLEKIKASNVRYSPRNVNVWYVKGRTVHITRERKRLESVTRHGAPEAAPPWGRLRTRS